MRSPWYDKVDDWDEPSIDNDSICEKFIKGYYEDKSVNMPYRLYVPKYDEGERIPLTLFLHGADVTGKDGEVHIRAHDIGSVFARGKWQDIRKQYVLAPQYHGGIGWSNNNVMQALLKIMDEVSKDYAPIDKSKICIYGYSAGGIGALKFMKEYPDLFNRAIIICAATKSEGLDKLSQTPFWLFHATDDTIVSNEKNNSIYAGGFLGSRGIYEALKDKMGDDIRYTEYAPGEMMKRFNLNPHCTWVPVSKNDKALTWLISG